MIHVLFISEPQSQWDVSTCSHLNVTRMANFPMTAIWTLCLCHAYVINISIRPPKNNAGDHPRPTCQNSLDSIFNFLTLTTLKNVQIALLDSRFQILRLPANLSSTQRRLSSSKYIHFLTTDITCCSVHLHPRCSGHDFEAFGCNR